MPPVSAPSVLLVPPLLGVSPAVIDPPMLGAAPKLGGLPPEPAPFPKPATAAGPPALEGLSKRSGSLDEQAAANARVATGKRPFPGRIRQLSPGVREPSTGFFPFNSHERVPTPSWWKHCRPNLLAARDSLVGLLGVVPGAAPARAHKTVGRGAVTRGAGSSALLLVQHGLQQAKSGRGRVGARDQVARATAAGSRERLTALGIGRAGLDLLELGLVFGAEPLTRIGRRVAAGHRFSLVVAVDGGWQTREQHTARLAAGLRARLRLRNADGRATARDGNANSTAAALRAARRMSTAIDARRLFH